MPSYQYATRTIDFCKHNLSWAHQSVMDGDEEMAKYHLGAIFAVANEELLGLPEYIQPGTLDYRIALNQYIDNTLADFRKESKKN